MTDVQFSGFDNGRLENLRQPFVQPARQFGIGEGKRRRIGVKRFVIKHGEELLRNGIEGSFIRGLGDGDSLSLRICRGEKPIEVGLLIFVKFANVVFVLIDGEALSFVVDAGAGQLFAESAEVRSADDAIANGIEDRGVE